MSDSAPAADAADAGDAASAVVTGMAIVTSNGVKLAAAPGSALPLEVVFTMSDGTTQPLPAGTQVTWTSPVTITAQDPNDAGPNSVLPDAGAQPTAFYVANPYRPDRTNYPGLLFVISEGSAADAGVGRDRGARGRRDDFGARAGGAGAGGGPGRGRAAVLERELCSGVSWADVGRVAAGAPVRRRD